MIICILFIIFTVYSYSCMIFYTVPIRIEDSCLHFLISWGLGDKHYMMCVPVCVREREREYMYVSFFYLVNNKIPLMCVKSSVMCVFFFYKITLSKTLKMWRAK